MILIAPFQFWQILNLRTSQLDVIPYQFTNSSTTQKNFIFYIFNFPHKCKRCLRSKRIQLAKSYTIQAERGGHPIPGGSSSDSTEISSSPSSPTGVSIKNPASIFGHVRRNSLPTNPVSGRDLKATALISAGLGMPCDEKTIDNIGLAISCTFEFKSRN